MKFIQNIFDKTRPHVEKGGKFEYLWSVHNGMETLFFVPGHTTHSGSHIRDAVDMKRTMITVVLAMVPAILFGAWNIGYQHHNVALGLVDTDIMTNFLYGLWYLVPLIAVSYTFGLGVEFVFAQIRRHPINEGFLVSGMLIPLIMPVGIPLWMVAISTVFAVIIGKEVFGGTGMNILNPALTARAFAFFAYPTFMSGDQVWINTELAEGQNLVDGFSGATALGQYASSGTSSFSAMDAFLGIIPGSVGETSVVAILLGALVLIVSGIGSWRIMLSMTIGGAVMGLIFNAIAPYAISEVQQQFFAIPFWHHLILGGFAFGTVFMATDPVSASQTTKGKWIYGFLTGFLAIMIRVFNPAYPEGVMLAILFMNVMAPLVDHYVVEANIKKRLKRSTVKTA